MMLTKLERRKNEVRNEIRKALKEARIGNKTVETRELLEETIRRASLYKYQKHLLLIETLQKLDEGDLDD